MYWATRRRVLYAIGVLTFFGVVFGGPVAYKYFTIPPTCFDGIKNEGETSVDRGGPCPLLDPKTLQPSTVLWTRSFKVRDGVYSVAAYVENPNDGAGVRAARYIFKLYDADNILVAEREGTTFVMPGGITPVFEGGIDTGHRAVAHALFEFTAPLVWEQVKSPARTIQISATLPSDTDTAPRIAALLRNASVAPLFDVSAVVIVFDTVGNAFAASSTHLQHMNADESRRIVFSWPDPFPEAIGRIDIIPLVAPVSAVLPKP